MTKIRKGISLLLTMALVISMSGMVVMAEDEEDVSDEESEIIEEVTDDEEPTIIEEVIGAEKGSDDVNEEDPVDKIVDEFSDDTEDTTDGETDEVTLEEDAETEVMEFAIQTYADVIETGECGDSVTWTLDSDGILTISGSGAMADYSEFRSPWFSYVNDIVSVVIEEGVTSIGSAAFFMCEKMESITIPSGVTSIGEYAFEQCKSLSNISLPDTLVSIEQDAFLNCGIESITIPASVTSIDPFAFENCSSLTEITVDSDNSVYSSADGVLFNKDQTVLISCPAGRNGEYVIPSTVTEIGESAFHTCEKLTSITIPDGVTKIGDDAFSFCYGLTSIDIPESVTTIGDRAFYQCNNIESISLPEGIEKLGFSLFEDCISLKEVYIPNSVTYIDTRAFSGCTGLTDVYYAGTEEEWDAIDISDYENEDLFNATIHYLETETVDKTALQEEYDEDEELNESDYTAESWSAFKAAMDNAKEVLDNDDATQEEVDAALDELVAAKDALEKKSDNTPDSDVDKTKLEDEVYSDIELGLNSSDYTSESWDEYEKALVNALTVLDDKNATQEEVDAALDELVKAREGLVSLEGMTGPGPVTNTGSGIGTTGNTGSGNNGAPKTGDTNNIALWFALLIAGVAAAVTGFAMKRRQH